jgi:hypothetical protein
MSNTDHTTPCQQPPRLNKRVHIDTGALLRAIDWNQDVIDDQEAHLAYKDAVIARKDAEIAALKAELAALKAEK